MQLSLAEMVEIILAGRCVCWHRSKDGGCSSNGMDYQASDEGSFRSARNSIKFSDLVLT